MRKKLLKKIAVIAIAGVMMLENATPWGTVGTSGKTHTLSILF